MDKNDDKKIRFSSINIDGVKYKTLLTEKFKHRTSYVETNLNIMTAFIPGTIVDVYIKEGKKVKEGDTLLILEAMKMRNVIQAPYAGSIKKLYVQKGDLVSKNQALVEME
ncbi:MAG: acetyl-CoA carboxylase biotin carboxyl carrier protein subunit [Bacteroidetes bacterium HGW-Bacteroidetes-16]|jgi:biotin carboxyl carrier protein|nr:MAG: acetyl-CoA carboxylase biotin carboxyl carrier protein subunit [Bacteroidetes bacterium HGW-Bacteroidetes-16]